MRVKAEKWTSRGEKWPTEGEKGSSLPGMRVAAAEELFPRLGGSRGFRESFEKSRRELAADYIDYIFTTSSALHAVSLPLAAFMLALCRATEPSSVADLGSGFSSHVLRVYAGEAAHPVRVASVDDSPSWLEKTEEFVERLGHSPDGVVSWADFKQTGAGAFDIVLYDLGTMDTRARELETVLAGAKQGALVVVDDVHYAAYRRIVEERASERHFVAYDLEELTRDEYGRFSWLLTRSDTDLGMAGLEPVLRQVQRMVD